MAAPKYSGGGIHALNTDFYSHQFKAVRLLYNHSELKPFDFSRSVEESVIDFLSKNPVWWKDTDFAMFVPKDDSLVKTRFEEVPAL